MTMNRFGAVCAALVLAGCAPPWSHIYSPAEGGDNTVTKITADPAPAGTWSPVFHETRDYQGHTITDTRSGGADGRSRNALTVSGSGTMNGLYGLRIAYDEPSTNWDDAHYRSGLKLEQALFVADRVYIFNEGDGVKPKADDVRLSRSWIREARDDCYQADYGHDGLVIEASFLDRCYSAISARPSSSIDASRSTLTIADSIVSVSDKDSCYKPDSYGCPNHAGWLKWEKDRTIAMRVALVGSTFAAWSYPEIGNLALNAPVLGCQGNTLDWLGPTSGSEYTRFQTDAQTWTAACPDTVVNVGPAATAHYSGVVQSWLAANPTVR